MFLFITTPRPHPLLRDLLSPFPCLDHLSGGLLSSGCSGLHGDESTPLYLPGRHRLRLEGRHLLGTSFGYSLGSCSLHRGGAHVRSRHLHNKTKLTVTASQPNATILTIPKEASSHLVQHSGNQEGDQEGQQ